MCIFKHFFQKNSRKIKISKSEMSKRFHDFDVMIKDDFDKVFLIAFKQNTTRYITDNLR